MDMTTSDPLVGATLDRRYFVESRIAGGGMATVYVAHDLRLDRRLALKVMHASLAQDPTFVQRFINEAHSVAKLSHPNVVQVFDQGEDRGHVFLAMEYVPGLTLREHLRSRGRLPAREALQVMAPVLAALGAAHQAGMIHRDVKPENVLITEDGRVKVADFGLARAVEQSQQGLTRTGTLMGTAAYLAPEQIEQGVADARTDVYSAGIMLYELLTGTQPHTGETPIAIAYQHVNEDVPRPSQYLPRLSPDVDDLVTKGTERDPRYRPSNAGQYLAKLLEVLGRMPERSEPAAGPMPPVGRAGATGSSITAPELIAGGAGPGTENATMVVDMGAVPPSDDYGDGYDEEADESLRRRRNLLLGIGGAIVAIVVFVAGWWLFLGRFEQVPDVTGSTLNSAREQVRTEGLVLVEAEERVYSDGVEAGRVARTEPAAEERMLPGEEVTAYVSLGPRVVEMPDLEGEDIVDALAELEDLGFGEDAVEQVDQDAEGVTPGEVISTEPAPGEDADREEGVTVTISRGIEVPPLVGQEQEEAERTLRQLDLNVEVVEQDSEEVEKGLVISQSPDSGRTVGAAGTVTITVSTGPPGIEVPDVVGMNVGEARQALEEAGFKVKVERIAGGRTVVHQSHEDKAPEDTEITITATPGGIELPGIGDDGDDD
ncbi:Stk1 family PASTA domain-containing Ser/Thr kinase [Nocardiopsis sp. LOL_012]|uniref:Stk1 family PASTA domain-containing Ser/Thr kinase n=1 Tax=Nocardiopsis sp. LOL_012 TaxID=3345409 RepID=UPI003A852710